MALETYNKKRDFKKTPEPPGKKPRKKSGQTFVVQKHAARRLHYDFRLELDGVLLSWAVPKGPSLDPKQKRLAVHVEDHPLTYGGFEGIIPEKQYGAGPVLLWDRGTWVPLGDARKSYREGSLKFELHGEKLHGRWALVRMGKQDGARENWLLIKERDNEARSGTEAEIVDREVKSVESGNTIEQIAALPAQAWRGGKARKLKSVVAEGRAVKLPETIKPQLATLVKEVPQGAGWLHEIKYDGYRILCRVEKGKARLVSRNGLDWTSRFHRIAAAAKTLPVKDGWFDGEVVVPDGSTDFQALQNTLNQGCEVELTYYLFDVIYCNGRDLRGIPLIERKKLLSELVAAQGPIRYSDHVEGNGDVFFAQACEHDLEGIISKQRDAKYVHARTRSWVKVKCGKRQEFVIGGYTDPAGSRIGLGALLVGVHDENGALRYAGKVGTGFNDQSLRELKSKLSEIEQEKSAFANPPRERGVHWVQPELVAEIAFAQWTDDEVIRHASFQGLRADKSPSEIVREKPIGTRKTGPARSRGAGQGRSEGRTTKHDAAKKSRSKSNKPLISSSHGRKVVTPEGLNPGPVSRPSRALDSGSRLKTRRDKLRRNDALEGLTKIRLTHPDKVLYAKQGVTKKDLALYYAAVADLILPHIENRPLTLVRCPNGPTGQCFYQKNISESVPEAIESVPIPDEDGTSHYMMANSPQALMGLVQMGVLEIHPWGATADDLDRPDRMFFDLDPDAGLDFEKVIEAAKLLRDRLSDLGLVSFLKTTGGKGLHVVVPLERRHTWNEMKGFSKALAADIVRQAPRSYTSKTPKAQRKGKIFIDYLRNGKGQTAVAAFSTRAKPGATVSVPLDWKELRPDLRPDHYNVLNLGERLKKLRRDPWSDFLEARQSLTRKMKRELGMK
ncbi:MAG: non-homologous end-joining DNA ligase [Burkholderiales bacterium]